MENQQPAGEAQNSQKKKPFYKKWWFITIAVIVVLSAIFGSSDEKKDNQKQTNATTEQASTQKEEQMQNSQTTEQVVTTAETKETAKPEQPVEPFEVAVSSQIVKKVGGKFRYFFDIRNNDKKDFSGKVSITLYNDKQSSALGSETFDTKSPIKPKLGGSEYIEINTGPISVHDEYGITKYKFEVKIDNKVVKSGEGKITTKYEDLSQYGL